MAKPDRAPLVKSHAVDQDRVLMEQARMLFHAAPLSIFGTYLGIAFVFMVLWPVADRDALLLWTLIFTAMNSLRLLHGIYHYRRQASINYRHWVREFAIIAFIASCFWGSASVFLFPVGHPIYQLMLAFVLVTTSAIAITNISMLLYVILPYIAITLSPIVVRFAMAQHEAMLLSAVMVGLATLLLLLGAYRSYKNIYETICLRIQEADVAQQLRDSQHRLSLHIQQTPMAVIEMDMAMRVMQWNEAAERIFGYPRDEALGRNLFELVVPDSLRADAEKILDTLLHHSGSMHTIYQNRTKSGETIQCEWFNTRLVDEQGQMVGLASLVQDVTQRARIEQMKDEFISVVSHELRTPLTSLRGSLGLVLGGMAGELPERAQGFIAMADKNAERLTLLINDILDIEGIESGLLKYQFEVLDLQQLIHDVVVENQAFAQQSNIVLHAPPSAANLQVVADASRIHQVLDNLLSNAIKFSPAGESIDIDTRLDGALVQVSVCDHGPGVAREFQAHLFEKFTQGEESRTRRFSGTGLGLSICRGIVEQHGGEIHYQPASGGGSCFIFSLRLSQ